MVPEPSARSPPMPFIGAETEWEVPYMAGQGLTGRGREGRFARQRARRMSDARRGLLGSGGIVARRGEATMQAIGRWSAQTMWHAAGTERRTAEHRGEELKRTGPSAGREGGGSVPPQEAGTAALFSGRVVVGEERTRRGVWIRRLGFGGEREMGWWGRRVWGGERDAGDATVCCEAPRGRDWPSSRIGRTRAINTKRAGGAAQVCRSRHSER